MLRIETIEYFIVVLCQIECKRIDTFFRVSISREDHDSAYYVTGIMPQAVNLA